MNQPILWQPDEGRMKQSQMFEFLQLIDEKYHLPEPTYPALHRWSVENIADFWMEFWDYAQILSTHQYSQVVDGPSKMPGAKWFSGAKLNFAENLLQYRSDKIAIIFRSENGSEKRISQRELYNDVYRVASGLKGWFK